MNDYAAYVRAALEAGADKAEVFGIDEKDAKEITKKATITGSIISARPIRE